MSETKFTPGPWVNHGRITQPGLPHSAVAADTLIARVYSKHFGDTEQEIANANLIAAAPDLAESLRAVLAAIPEDAIKSSVRIPAEMALVKAGLLTLEPRFSRTSCSQCGCELGAGNSGVSHCSEHGA